ncbi:MAG: calcium/sodium antiporter [Bacillota bacterium]
MVFLWFTVGLTLIVKGADWFTDSAVWIAKATQVPQVIIGATLVSLGTTLPELSVSVYASATGHPDVAVGNAVGSVIANIGLVLGLTVLMRSRAINRRLFMLNGGFMLGTGLLVTLMAQNGEIGRPEALVLLLVLGIFVRSSFKIAGAERAAAKSGPRAPAGSIRHQVLMFLLGAIMIGGGSRMVVTNATVIAGILGIPQLVVGLTLVAVGTSLPELVTAVTATVKGHHDISVGNILGANFLNLTWVTGGAALVSPLAVAGNTQVMDLPFMILSMVILLAFGLTKHTLSRWEGGLLLLFYAGYVAALFLLLA